MNFNIFMSLRSKAEDFVYEWMGKGRSKLHIRKEFERHNKIAVKACEYLGTLLLLLVIYLYGNGEFCFHYFFIALALLYISAWLPDFLYLFGNVIKREKRYIPTHKRKYSHGYLGIFSWSVFVFLLSYKLTDIFWSIIFASIAFIGYWLHLVTDKIELFIDRIAEFVEKAFKEGKFSQ